MKLTFPIGAVLQALDELRGATACRTLYDEQTGKGLWLVGDQGVYLMPNTTDGPLAASRKPGDSNFVVYARECDPTKLEFDTWWANKRASFGGDDGVEFIAMADIEQLTALPPGPGMVADHLFIEITASRFSMGVGWKPS
jgi:Protein of unknown function (DUF3085)